MAFTFGGPLARGKSKGRYSQGGFAKFWRGSSHFAVKIPDGLDLASVSPLMCGGVTVYSPLKKYGAGKTAKNVGVMGVGGLGHMAIMIANAMGANVTAISRGDSKKEDALKLGAKSYIATGNNLAEDLSPYANTLDLIICTISKHGASNDMQSNTLIDV
jgi:D-arabinose 1-dehydrogenase-like Zn-dependent alcohol dehydrogenase